MSDSSKPAGRVALLLFLCFGLAALVGAGWVSVFNLRFRAVAVRTEGIVVELVPQQRSTRSRPGRTNRTATEWAPVFEFRDATGATNRVTSSSSSRPASHEIGEKVPVLYPAGAPQEARIDSFWGFWQGPIVLGILGAFLTSVAIVGIVQRARRG